MWDVEKIVSNGKYDYAVVPDHPDSTEHGYVLHHRIVKENEMGEVIGDGKIVHHKDGDTKNNSPENLEIMERKQHSSMHTKERGKNICVMRCPNCGEIFIEVDGRTQLVRDKIRTCCSRKCHWKMIHKDGMEVEKSINILHRLRVYPDEYDVHYF